MNVLFKYSPDFSKISAVYWQSDTVVMRKLMRADGSVVDEKVDWSSLAVVLDRVASEHTAMYPATVDDLRSAFQYLGKASDLVETLPEADIANRNSPTERSE